MQIPEGKSSHRHHGTPHYNREPRSIFASIPRRSPKAILNTRLLVQWSLQPCRSFFGMTMTAMKMMWSFWKTSMPAGVRSKVNDIWLLVSKALLDVVLGPRACFRMGRASFWQLIHLCENTLEAATIVRIVKFYSHHV